jgi:hypothetical protein
VWEVLVNDRVERRVGCGAVGDGMFHVPRHCGKAVLWVVPGSIVGWPGRERPRQRSPLLAPVSAGGLSPGWLEKKFKTQTLKSIGY